MSDYRRWIKGLKERDEAAFEAVYSASKNAVYAAIVAIVKNRAAAEDLMQETYEAMFEHIYSYDDSKNFLTWLLTIARNKAIDYYRRDRFSTTIDPQQDLNRFTEKAQAETKAEVADLLSVLTPREREVVLLRVVADVKFKDIARLTGRPIGTVLWLYQVAIRKMRKHGGEDDA